RANARPGRTAWRYRGRNPRCSSRRSTAPSSHRFSLFARHGGFYGGGQWSALSRPGRASAPSAAGLRSDRRRPGRVTPASTVSPASRGGTSMKTVILLLASALLAADPAEVKGPQGPTLLHTLKTSQGGPAAFSPDGKLLAVGDQVWDVDSGKLLRTFT